MDNQYLAGFQLKDNAGMNILLHQLVLKGKQIGIYLARLAFPLSVCTKRLKCHTTPNIIKKEFGKYQKHVT